MSIDKVIDAATQGDVNTLNSILDTACASLKEQVKGPEVSWIDVRFEYVLDCGCDLCGVC